MEDVHFHYGFHLLAAQENNENPNVLFHIFTSKTRLGYKLHMRIWSVREVAKPHVTDKNWRLCGPFGDHNVVEASSRVLKILPGGAATPFWQTVI